MHDPFFPTHYWGFFLAISGISYLQKTTKDFNEYFLRMVNLVLTMNK